jgi:zinc protease
MNLKGLLILAMLIMASLIFATIDPSLSQYPLPQDPAVVSGRLPNGVKYFVQQNSVPPGKVELRLMVNAGSICEDDDQRGLAHFTEHMLFNGTRSFPKSAMIDFLNSVGMGYMNGLNGMTSYDYTVYMFSLPTQDQEVLQRGFLLLSEMAHAANFDPVELEKERGVIIEEWRMGQNADSRVRERTNEINFQGSRYTERSPIGTYDVLSTFTREQILRFYNDWYRPDLQTVVVWEISVLRQQLS